MPLTMKHSAPARVRSASLPWSFALLLLPAVFGCGGSHGGGGGGGSGGGTNTITIDRSTGSSTLVDQPADDRTVLRWRLHSDNGGKALCGLEYKAGDAGAWTPIESRFLEGLATPAGSGATFEIDTAATDQDFKVTWKHREQLGLPSNEARAIAVRLRTADAVGATDLTQEATLVTAQTLGREDGEIRGPGGAPKLSVARAQPADTDSAFVVTGELADFGGDVGSTSVLVDWTTKSSPGAGDWTRLSAPKVTFGPASNPAAKAEEALVFPVTIAVDPHATGDRLPLGALQALTFRVTWQEDPSARFPATGRVPATHDVASAPVATVIGKAPVLARITTATNDAPFVVPFSITVGNPSTRDAEILVTGRYTYGSPAITGPMSFRQDDPSKPAAASVRFPIAGVSSLSRSVLWNAIGDLGMGAGGDPQSDLAYLQFTVTVVDALPDTGRSFLSDSQLAPDPMTVQTHAFTGYFNRHDAIATGIAEGTRATGQRDTFFVNTTSTLGSVGIVQRANPAANPDWVDGFLPGEIVEGLIPLRVGAGGPACAVVLRSGGVRVFEWPAESASTGSVTMRTVSHGAAGRYTGSKFVAFPREACAFAVGGKELFGFVTWEGPTFNGTTGRFDVEYVLNLYVRQGDGSWKWTDNTSASSTLRFTTSFATLPAGLEPAFVLGELDRNPATAEIVVVSAALQRTDAEAALALWSVSVDGADDAVATRRLVTVPNGWLSPNESAAAVRLALHPSLAKEPGTGAPRAGVVFAVDVATGVPANQSARLFTSLLESPTPTWTALPVAGLDAFPLLDPIGKLLVSDLDGDGVAEYGFTRSRTLFVLRAASSARPAAWVRASYRGLETDPELAGHAIVGFADVDGDGRPDLALSKGANRLRFAVSAYAGAVSGFRGPLSPITIVGGEANFVKYSGRPLAFDFNLDGVGPDYLVNGEILLRRPETSGFLQVDASQDPVRWAGNPRSHYWLDRMSTGNAASEVDVLCYERGSPRTTTGAVFQVTRIALGHRPTALAQRPLLVRDESAPAPFAWRLDFARPVVAPAGTGTDGEKWLLALASNEVGATERGLLRFTFDGTRYVPQPTALLRGDFVPEFATVRLGALVAGASDIARNTRPQDVFVAPAAGHEVWWLRAADAFTQVKRVVALPRATEQVCALASGSLDADAYEDLAIVTREPVASGATRVRVYLLAQDATKVFEVATPLLIARFDTAPGVDSVLGIDFDRTALTRAPGAIAWEKFGTFLGETRILRHDPTAGGSGFRALVCPGVRADYAIQELASATLQFLDADGDGIPTLLLGPTYKLADPGLPNPRTVYVGEYAPR